MRCTNPRCQADNAAHQSRCVVCQAPLVGADAGFHGATPRRPPTVVDPPLPAPAAAPPFYQRPPHRQPTVNDVAPTPEPPPPAPAFYPRPRAEAHAPAPTPGAPHRAKTVVVGATPAGVPHLRAVLVEFRGPDDPGSCHFLREGRNAIGRDDDCEVRLDEASISKTHAFIYLDADGMRLVDNSQNGTIVDGRTIRGAQVSLSHGSKLDLGNARFVFVPIPAPFEK
ncbi:MAG: FHA domain-containing protein [Labilithrix sp.]